MNCDCDFDSNSGCFSGLFFAALAIAPMVGGLYYVASKYEKSEQTAGEVLHIEKASQPRKITTQSYSHHCGQSILPEKQRSNWKV